MEELIELYKEGLTMGEISEETGLASSTVGAYIYKEKINHDPAIMEVRKRAVIKRMISDYEEEFKIKWDC